MTGTSIGSFGDSADITLSLDTQRVDISDDDAVEACEAVADWASGIYDGDVTIAITGSSGELAGSTDGALCSAG